MSLRQYQALAAVGDHRSFARAGEALNLSQSAISMQISALEARLGTTLFDRAKRPPRLTRAGEIALRHARLIVEQENEMRDALGATRGVRDAFRLGVIPTALTSLMPDALMRLRARHPELVVSVVSELSGPLVDMADAGEVDAALTHRPAAERQGLEWREIARQRLVAVAPPDAKESDVAALFANRPYIRFNRRAWVAPMIEERLRALALSPPILAEIQSIDAIHLMVGLGFGASVLPDVGPRPFEPAPLKILPLGDGPGFAPLHRSIGLVSRREGRAKRMGRLVGDAFEDAAKNVSA